MAKLAVIPEENRLPFALLQVDFDFESTPDQHQAANLLRAAQLTMLVSLVSTVLLFNNVLDGGLSWNHFLTPTRLAHLSIIISSPLIFLGISYQLNLGKLYSASRVFVAQLIFIATVNYITHSPTNAIILLFSPSVVAAGVLLKRRDVARAGFAVTLVRAGKNGTSV